MRSTPSVKSLHRDFLGLAPRRDQRRLVDQVGEVGAGEAGRQGRDLLRRDVGGELMALEVEIDDVDAPALVRPVDQHLAVETAGAQQRRIEDFGPVGRREQHQAAARIEAVHLDQQLVQRLLLLVVAHIGVGAAGAAQRVEFVDENDRRRLLARLHEEVAHPRRADADEHLDEFRPVDREERHAGFAGDRAREQRLAGARRPDQQHALGHPGAEAGHIPSGA